MLCIKRQTWSADNHSSYINEELYIYRHDLTFLRFLNCIPRVSFLLSKVKKRLSELMMDIPLLLIFFFLNIYYCFCEIIKSTSVKYCWGDKLFVAHSIWSTPHKLQIQKLFSSVQSFLDFYFRTWKRKMLKNRYSKCIVRLLGSGTGFDQYY